jgi:glycine cleavage system H protein
LSYPDTYRYTKDHEWIAVDGALGSIGITVHAQETLGDIVFVEMPRVGTEVEQGRTFGTVESVKAVSDLFSPVSGQVVELNGALESAPEQINADAHASWIIRVRLSDPSQVDSLLTAADYEKFVAEETGK